MSILYEKRDKVAIITINRPDKLNAIDPQTSQELVEAWRDSADTQEGMRAFAEKRKPIYKGQ